MNSEQPTPPIPLEDTLRYLAVADEFRRQRRAVEAHLEVTDREKIREHLLRQYEQGGVEEDPALIDEAIDIVLSQKLRFRAPQASAFELWAATCYVLRRKILLWAGLPIVGLVVVSFVVSWLLDKAERERLLAEERAVEARIESLYQKDQHLRLALDQLLGEAGVLEKAPMPFQQHVEGIRTALERTMPFFTEYAPAGSARESVTPENYSGVGPGILRAADDLEETERSLAAARGLLQEELKLRSLEEQLQALAARIRSSEPTAGFASQAEALVEDALGHLREREIEKATARFSELESVYQRSQEAKLLLSTAAQTLESIRTLAKDEAVVAESVRLNASAGPMAEAGNLDELRSTVDRLKEVERSLVLEYDIVIVGGVWRYKPDNRAVRNYYLRVQALDRNGRAVRLKVRNEETGREETVSEWAERVPQAIYDRVAQDKQDNGIIDDKTFGNKVRGELAARRKFDNLGQITSW